MLRLPSDLLGFLAHHQVLLSAQEEACDIRPMLIRPSRFHQNPPEVAVLRHSRKVTRGYSPTMTNTSTRCSPPYPSLRTERHGSHAARRVNDRHAFGVDEIACHLIRLLVGQFWKAPLPKSGLLLPSAEAV